MVFHGLVVQDGVEGREGPGGVGEEGHRGLLRSTGIDQTPPNTVYMEFS